MSTILNQKEAELLNSLVIKYGDIVSIDQVYTEFDQYYSKVWLKKFVSKMLQKGWLIRLKRGQYLISNLDTRGYLSLSQYAIANALVKESYVSFGLALQYHGMFDQLLATATSVSLKRQQTVLVQNTKYKYIYTTGKFFYGWSAQRLDDREIRVASVEKALIDMLLFYRTTHSIDLVLEKLSNYHQQIDFNLLIKYATLSTITVQKILGFLLDIAGLDTQGLQVNDSVVRMTAKSDVFNARWGLYYDAYFNQYLGKNYEY
ncbi:hypothetical protein KJ628_02145 [Patescibacteria group bacterium]|nr:hypothetical protein [Patescibacteria group bacterium]